MCLSIIGSLILDHSTLSMLNGSLMILEGGIKGYKVLNGKDSSTQEKVFRLASALAESGFGCYLFYVGSGHNPILFSTKTIDPSSLKQNCLLVTAEGDYNGAIEIGKQYLGKAFRSQCRVLKQTTVSSLKGLCDAIKSAEEQPITKLIIIAHGAPYTMAFSFDNFFDSQISIFSEFPPGCFSGLAKDAHVYLISCSTGEWLDRGIAAHIARESGRSVTAPYFEVNPRIDVHVNSLDIQDPSGGIRFTSSLTRLSLLYSLLLKKLNLLQLVKEDTTVTCSPKGECTLFNSLSKGTAINLTYFLIKNALIQNALNIKILSMTASLLASVLDEGMDIIAPNAQKLIYGPFDPTWKPTTIDSVKADIYFANKNFFLPVIRGFGKISSIIDTITYYGLKGVAKTATYSGSYLEKGIDYLSDITPQSNHTSVNLAGKTVKVASKIAFRLLNWSGRGLDYVLG